LAERGFGGREQRGSALLAVFWGIVVLSMATAGWFLWLQERIQAHGEEGKAAEALAMAHSGVAIALNPRVDRFSSLLRAEVAPGMGYRVEIESESSRLKLAWLLENEADPRRIHLFRRWLETVIGLELKDANRLVDCLLDYVDPDTLPRLNGQEDQGDYHPANRPLQSLEELKRIPGLEPLVSYPGWSDLLTLESSGAIDLLQAPEEVLKLVPGMGDETARRLVLMRAGPDQVLNTEDDPKFAQWQDVLTWLRVSPAQKKAMDGMVTANDQTFRIKSEGYSGKVVRQVQVVVRKGSGPPQIRSWIE
jgi:type II secretory pathway component PulK